MILLGVNIDHVATLRQARGTSYPNITEAAELALAGGADGITVHLREDRRHIQDTDVRQLAANPKVRLNLEMALTAEMMDLALELAPQFVCLVPEKREELTTEGGLDLLRSGLVKKIQSFNSQLAKNTTQLSIFIDPDLEQVAVAKETGAPLIELHTGSYAEAFEAAEPQVAGVQRELEALTQAAAAAKAAGLSVNAGHGLNLANLAPILTLPGLHELNIGHAIVCRAISVGLRQAVREMKEAIASSRD